MWVKTMFESCVEIRSHFSDYLDHLCTQEARKSVNYHLSFCPSCQKRLEQMQSVQEELRAIPRRRVPAELALRLRVQMSHRLNPNFFSSLWVRLENTVKPLLIPATGGVLTAVISFCLIMGSQGIPAGNGQDVSNDADVTMPLATPARVLQLAPMDFNTGDGGLVVLTQINAEGRVKGYQILSGQRSPEIMHRLDLMVYYSVFKPATMFGRPTDGEVVLSLRRITVRG